MIYKVAKEYEGLALGQEISTDENTSEAEQVKFDELVAEGVLEVVDEKGVVYDGPMADYKVLQEFPLKDENGEVTGTAEVGSVLNLPVPVGEGLTNDGLVEAYVNVDNASDATVQADHANEEQAADDIATDEPVKLYDGKRVISEGVREVEGKVFHTLRLEDGSTYDVTDEDYETKVTVTSAE